MKKNQGVITTTSKIRASCCDFLVKLEAMVKIEPRQKGAFSFKINPNHFIFDDRERRAILC